jgi:tetratricopeptide (TPR) repeat protein
MPKSSKPKKKEDAPIKADIKIDGDVTNANIIVGHGNTINVEAIKSATSLFTIPLPVRDFTGREKEIEELKAAFSRGAVISGVSGGGGIGMLGTSENPLAPEEVMRRILEPFYPNQKLPDQPEQLQGLYQQTFAKQKALLLLDNAANAAQVRPLIPPAPSAAIITSRQHFTLTEFDLTPLRLDVLSPEKAREFLRAMSSKLKDAPDAEVDELAALCGHLPLALRVAASLLNDRADWTPATLLNRLAEERTRLSRLKREGDLDVESTLSLSYNLLDDDLKTKFRQLGVFTAPFVKISAQAVWDLQDETETDDYLGKLANRSLLSLLSLPLGENNLQAYVLHDLTRLFAESRLLENQEQAQSAIMRHADHFLGWGSDANTLYKKGNENILLGLAQFRFIWAHLLSAYERLLPDQKSHARPDEADRWLSDFPLRCTYVLDLHLPPRQKIPILEAALDAARRLGDKGDEGNDLGNLGLAYADLGDARKAIEFHEQQLVIVREIGDRRGEGNDLGNLGLAYADLGDARKAIEFHEQQLVIVREIGDRRGEGAALGNLGNAYAALGDARKAIEFYEQALMIAREIGDRRGEGNALGSLGLAYADLGDVNKAIEFHEQALLIHREIGDRRGEGNALGNLGLAYAALGDARKAIEFYEQNLSIAREIGDRRGEGAALGNLGNAYKTLGENEKAKQVWEQALQIFRAIESPHVKTVETWLANLDDDTQGQGMTVEAFIRTVFQVAREKRPQGEQLFGQLSKMAVDPNQPPEIQSLAKVLRDVMAGGKNPDLSQLPEELAKVVKEELEKK